MKLLWYRMSLMNVYFHHPGHLPSSLKGWASVQAPLTASGISQQIWSHSQVPWHKGRDFISSVIFISQRGCWVSTQGATMARECDPTTPPTLEAHLPEGRLLCVYCGEREQELEPPFLPLTRSMHASRKFTLCEPEFLCCKMGRIWCFSHRVVWGKWENLKKCLAFST